MANQRLRKSLLRRTEKGVEMICPRCKTWQSVFAYIPEKTIPEYEHETVPIIKCPLCRWRFAPSGS